VWQRRLTPVVPLLLLLLLAYRIFWRPHAGTGTGPGPGRSESSTGAPAPFASLSVTRLTETGDVLGAVVSRDGKYLAYSSFSSEGQFALSVRQIATRSTVELLAQRKTPLLPLAFSPDGSFIYYALQATARGGSYYEIPSLGGTPRLVVSGLQSPHVALSFDGKKIAYVGTLPGEEKAALIAADIGEQPQPAQALVRNVSPDTIDDLAWSPDGQTLALLQSHPDPSGLNTGFFTMAAAGGAPQPLGSRRWRGSSGGLAWLPDGSGLMFNAQARTGALSQVWYVSYPGADARQLTSDLLGHQISLSLTGDGKAFVGLELDHVSNLWMAPKGEAKSARQVTSGRSDGTSGLAWTGDGKLVYISTITDYHQLWLAATAGSAPRPLTTDAAYHAGPTVCRGAERVFYASDSSGSMQLWSASLEDGQMRQETHSAEQFSAADCSPDGTWFAGLTAPKGVTVYFPSLGKVTRLERASGEMRALFEQDAQAPVISPDGKHVAFLYTPAAAAGANPEGPRIGIVAATGGPLEKSFEVPPLLACPNIRWMPDGRAVVYAVLRANIANLWAQPVKGGPPRQVTHFTDGAIFNFAWSGDGRELALARGSVASDAVLFTSAH